MPHLQNLSGRKVSQHHWHITLAFLGNVTDDMYECVQQQAGQVSGQSFDLTLDTVGHWSRPKVTWLGCYDMHEEMQSLVAALNSELNQCGYEPEYKDFKPHMTLMRKVTRKPKDFLFEPVPWHINQFVLIESLVDNTGSRYNVIGEWALN